MMEFISMLVSFFLTGPLQAEISEKLAAARAPQAIVTQMTDCARDAAPALLERAMSDPWWAATSSFSVWTGWPGPRRSSLRRRQVAVPPWRRRDRSSTPRHKACNSNGFRLRLMLG